MSVDEDFVDPRISKPRSSSSSSVSKTGSISSVSKIPSSLNTSRVDEILSQAESRRDKLRMSRFEKTKKRGREKVKSKEKVEKRGGGGEGEEVDKYRTSKYFKKDVLVIDLDSSEDDETMSTDKVGDCEVSEGPKVNEDASLDLPTIINIDESSTSTNNSEVEAPYTSETPEDLSPAIPGVVDEDSQPVSSTDSGIDPSQDDIEEELDNTMREEEEEEDCSDTDLFNDNTVDTLQFSVSAHTDRVYLYDYTG